MLSKSGKKVGRPTRAEAEAKNWPNRPPLPPRPKPVTVPLMAAPPVEPIVKLPEPAEILTLGHQNWCPSTTEFVAVRDESQS
mgnify:CR=1 FL=1